MTMDSMRNNITQMYRNFVEDDTWKNEISESSQVIALATQVAKLQNDMKTTIALATVLASSNGSTLANDAAPSRQGKKQPYTVKP